jgi:LysM repeat protein
MTVSIIIIIHSGDTLAGIASETGQGLSAGQLEQINPGVSPSNLQVGSSLKIEPQGDDEAFCRVRSGDTEFAVEQAFGVGDSNLRGNNPNVNFDNPQIGQLVVV